MPSASNSASGLAHLLDLGLGQDAVVVGIEASNRRSPPPPMAAAMVPAPAATGEAGAGKRGGAERDAAVVRKSLVALVIFETSLVLSMRDPHGSE